MPDETLAPFPGVDAFYDYRGAAGSEGAPPIWLPVHQGDVFTGLSVPGIPPIDAVEPMVMVFMHPCVMRRGSVLTQYVTVFRVRPETAKAKSYEDYANYFGVLPLPDLGATGRGVYFAEFQMVGTVRGEKLSRADRISSLSEEGRLLLQQRAVNHFTRHKPPLHDLRNRTRPVEIELGLLADWCERAHDQNGGTPDVVATAEKEFDAYLTADGRRPKLEDANEAHKVISDVQKEITRRYGPA